MLVHDLKCSYGNENTTRFKLGGIRDALVVLLWCAGNLDQYNCENVFASPGYIRVTCKIGLFFSDSVIDNREHMSQKSFGTNIRMNVQI